MKKINASLAPVSDLRGSAAAGRKCFLPWLALAWSLCAFPFALQGQNAPGPGVYIPSQLNMFGSTTPANYRIGLNDGISVKVFSMPEFDRILSVNSQGFVRLGYLRQPMPAVGKTAQQLADEIARALRREQLVLEPQVDVAVIQVRSKPITVTGAVRSPTIIQADRPITLLDAILRAGGPTDIAGTTVIVSTSQRASAAGSSSSAAAPLVRLTTYDIPLNKILGGDDPRANLTLQGDDHVVVLWGGKVYAEGAVRKPGGFNVPPGSSLTIAQVLSLAHGISRDAENGNAVIIRTDLNGDVRRVPVNLSHHNNARIANIRLYGNDVLYIPKSGFKSVAYFTLKGVVSSGFWALGYLLIKP